MNAIRQPFPCRRTRVLAVLPLALSAWLTSGCFGLRAKTLTVPTALDMPEPPPRVVEVHEPDVPPPIRLPEEPVRNTPTLPRPAPTPSEPARPNPPAPETPVDAKPEELTPRPATTLQTTPTQREEEVERRIRVLLGQAMGDLNRINYQALTTDGRTQYEQAKRFVSQSEEALRAKNLVFANNLADKAATLAAQLLGR
jgi:outer membrane biosynthesis protein TonB